MNQKLEFFVILIIHGAASSGLRLLCPSEPLRASVKENVLLRCHLAATVDTTDMTVEWSLSNSTVHLYEDRNDHPEKQNPKFVGRTSLSREGLTRGNLSLKLISVQAFDTGTYRCSLSSGNTANSCYLRLNVDGRFELYSLILTIAVPVCIFIIIAITCRRCYFATRQQCDAALICMDDCCNICQCCCRN